MEHHSAVLLRRLNPYCARAQEGAASLCQTRAHAEITPEHWLLKLLEQGEGDLTVLTRRYTELLSLEHNLSKRVVGQHAALSAIAQRLRASKTGLTPENGPQGFFYWWVQAE